MDIMNKCEYWIEFPLLNGWYYKAPVYSSIIHQFCKKNNNNECFCCGDIKKCTFVEYKEE